MRLPCQPTVTLAERRQECGAASPNVLMPGRRQALNQLAQRVPRLPIG